jgi:GT2 family glycosyltransferase
MSSNAIHISIIVPVYNSRQELRECLSALIASSGPDCEIIVVDDSSSDGTPDVAAQMGVRVLRLAKNSGPSAARNYGVRHARGDILFFVDADVVVMPGAVIRVAKIFAEHPDIAAVFGSYDASPRARGLVSQYRNLLHHFVHQKGDPEASTFWAGCGAVRRTAFEEIGGFDEKRFPRYIEDIELGYRLRRACHRIFLDKGLHGTHLKRWTLPSMIRTDIIGRAVPWARLILESKNAPHDLNLKPGQRLSVVLAGLATLFLVLALFRIELLGLSAAAFAGVIVLNRDLYGFFRRQRGLFFAVACVPLHILYYLYGGLTFLYVTLEFRIKGAVAIERRADQTFLTTKGTKNSKLL